MSPDGADSIRAERNPLRIPPINLIKSLFAIHQLFILIKKIIQILQKCKFLVPTHHYILILHTKQVYNFGAKIINYIGNKKKKLLYFTSVTHFFEGLPKCSRVTGAVGLVVIRSIGASPDVMLYTPYGGVGDGDHSLRRGEPLP